MNSKNINLMKWIAKIIAIVVLVFGLPFYFGYGNPLPFIDSSYTFFDNLWLTIFPLMFIGLALGIKFEKVGGYLVTIPLLVGFSYSLIIGEDFALLMIIPFVVGLMYLFIGYKKLI